VGKIEFGHGGPSDPCAGRLCLLLVLLVGAARFGLDVVLGAMLAGMVHRTWTRRMGVDAEPLETKLEAVGYGIFIPIFLVASGMTLDIHEIISAPLRLLVFLLLLLVVRGLPSLLSPGRRRRPVGSAAARQASSPPPSHCARHRPPPIAGLTPTVPHGRRTAFPGRPIGPPPTGAGRPAGALAKSGSPSGVASFPSRHRPPQQPGDRCCSDSGDA